MSLSLKHRATKKTLHLQVKCCDFLNEGCTLKVFCLKNKTGISKQLEVWLFLECYLQKCCLYYWRQDD